MHQEIGNWSLREPIGKGIWSDWFSGQHRQSKQLAWLRCLSTQQLDANSIKLSRPSLSRMRRYAAFNVPVLQKLFSWEAIDGKLLLAVQPLDGELFASQLQIRRFSTEETLVVIRQCVTALESLHRSDLTHGRFLPDRMYLGPQLELILVCDPLCRDTTRVTRETLGLLGSGLPQGLTCAHFIAPEFLVPSFTATKSSDIYSLGCLWWMLQYGRPPVTGENDHDILIAQAQRRRDAAWKADLPDPLAKCLKYCLAKNPAARFADAVAFRAAFEQALQRSGIELVMPSSTAKPAQFVPAAPQNQSINELANKPATGTQERPSPAVKLPASTNPSSSRRTSRRKRGPKWLLPAIGGTIAGTLLLAVLLSGVFTSKQPAHNANNAASGNDSAGVNSSAAPITDPRSERYDIVASSNNDPWLPPSLPRPIGLDLLPQGGQLFLYLRPRQIFAQTTTKQILSLFDDDLAEFWKQLQLIAGVPVESIESCILAVYPRDITTTSVVFRIQLAEAIPLSKLRELCSIASELRQDDHTLLVSRNQTAYYVPNQPLVNSQSLAAYSVGPLDMMKEVSQAKGVAGPLNAQVERLLQHTDATSDVCILLSPPFLFGDGRSLLENRLPELQSILQPIIGGDVRAAVLRMNFEPMWYLESRLIGTSDRDAVRLSDQLKRQMASSEADFQKRIVAQVPHSYWRELAFKFPRMLEVFSRYARTGTENGEAILNAYLPSSAASNMLFATWLALRETSSGISSDAVATTAAEVSKPMDMESFLNRAITLRFDQEAIEVALQLIADEANSGMPSGSPKVRFELDGGAFEKNGITRNQQIRDFQHSSSPMRDALTALAKRGNPDPSVTDLRQPNQKLIWLVKDDPTQPGARMISLTTRDAAKAGNIPLPTEFASP